MKLAIPQAVSRRVAEHFEPQTFERGLAYAREGRVNLVRLDWPVVATVRGSDHYVVTVHHTPASRDMRGDCSCPVAVDCKHAVAAALVALAGSRDLDEARRSIQKQEAVGAWLAGIAVATDDTAPGPTSRNVIAYVMECRDGALGLTVHRTAMLRRGGFGRSSVLAALGDPARGAPPWVGVEDLRRIALLRAVARAGPSELVLRLDRVDGALLAELAASGHLFWERVGTAPLTAGPPARGVLRWREDPDRPGEHCVALDGDRILVPAREVHYIDLATATIGPLDLGVPAALVQQLVQAPPVPTPMLATVRRSLRPLLGPEAAPALAADDDVDDGSEVGAAALRPHLFVSVETDDTGRERFVATRAEAVYGDARFELAEWDPRRPAPRDMVEEGRQRQRLEALRSEGAGRRTARPSAQDLMAEARHVAERVVPVLASEGWRCEVAADFPVEPVAAAADWVEALRPVDDEPGWFSLELGVVLAGRTVPLLPILLRAIRDGTLPLDPEILGAESLPGINLRLPDGERVHVPGPRLQRWLRPLVELELRGLADEQLIVPDVAAVEIADAVAGPLARAELLAEARARVEQLLTLEPRTEEPSFGGVLRPYQRRGLAWLRFLHDAGYGGLLADDMGLGKTVQVLAFLDGLRAGGALDGARPALVVSPRSVVGHWRAEAARFAAELEPAVHLGPERARSPAALQRSPLVVTSYQTLLRDLALFRKVSWTTVIFDEAQALKNPETRLRRGAAALRARSRFCITGTPIENHLRELWSQVDLVMPGLLGRPSTFAAVFRRPVEKYGDERALDLLRRRIRPFLLRRTKSAVDVDLPAKTEILERVELGSSQRDLYESLRLSLDDDVRAALRDRGVQGSSLVVLDALLKLRQCCCDPRLVKTPLAQEVNSSAKLERLMSMLEELVDAGRSVLVFSQFTSMLRLIEAECRKAEIPFLKLTGSTRKRDEVVRAFQDGAAPVFLISLKAGGTGLNLTRADAVIHYDPWWNPAAEDQATDRAHRIGQDQHVFVYKLVARGTLEERIAELQARKRVLTEAALQRGGVTHLAADDLAALYQQIV